MPVPAPSRARSSRFENLRLYALSVGVLIGLWAAIAPFFPEFILPGPLAVAWASWELFASGEFFLHMSRTLLRVVAGFLGALAVGILIGVGMGINRQVETFWKMEILIGLTIPGLMWAVISVLWFGLTDFAAIFAIVIITSPMITLNIWEGTKALDTKLVQMARTLRASRGTIVREIVVPQLIPYLLSGTRLGLSLAWKVVVISEMVGLDTGIGHQISHWFGLFSMTKVMAWTFSFTLIMLLLEFGVIYPIERRITRWRPEAKEAFATAQA
ncbi:MAG: ABC transporter permease [Deltaproteobacteria bacterium]|nr:ABC transporter permease [Deltaproteobacteria bacterium]